MQQLGEIRHRIEDLMEITEPRGCRVEDRLADSREAIDPGAQTVEFAGCGECESHTSCEAFEVGQIRESLPQILQDLVTVDQLRHRSVPFSDFFEVEVCLYCLELLLLFGHPEVIPNQEKES